MDTALLKQLSEARGVSGDESEVRNILAKVVRSKADELRTDTIGNLIAFKKGDGTSGLRVMVAAHMDEVGLMIMGADGNGFLRFRTVGGIDARVLAAKRVLVGKDRVAGIIGVKPVHLTEPAERRNVLRVEQLYIDIGAKSKDEALGAAPIGCYASFDTPFSYMGDADAASETGRIAGKALDDRAGCFTIAGLLDRRYPCDLYVAFTVQEEVGLRGAKVAAYSINPDLAIAVEGTVCDDSPREEDVSPTTRLGHGPAISVADSSMVADRRIVDILMDAAEAEGIPYQVKQPMVGGTDAGAITLEREGIPVAAVAAPCRYIHSPESVLDLADLNNLARLIGASLDRLPAAWSAVR
ncbi:MAG: M42 family metallopeptidase [Anaerolineae bacterium]